MSPHLEKRDLISRHAVLETGRDDIDDFTHAGAARGFTAQQQAVLTREYQFDGGGHGARHTARMFAGGFGQAGNHVIAVFFSLSFDEDGGADSLVADLGGKDSHGAAGIAGLEEIVGGRLLRQCRRRPARS